MRVLIIPELYRRRDASANATLNDAVTWVERWLAAEESLHVYWLLPHRADANYEREYVLADRERVTLIEADPLMLGTDEEFLFTESGYSEDQLTALKREIFDEFGYVDVVVDQLRQGRGDLYKWLLYLSGHRADEPQPFSVIVNVHDLMLPYKYPNDGYRATYHRRLEAAEALLADGRWFKARLDAEELPVFSRSFLRPEFVESAMSAAVLTDSPIDLDRFEERYADRPRLLHVAGSGWEKKRHDLVMEIAELLHERYGIETVITSMNEIPAAFAEKPWVEAHPEAPRQKYEETLRRGDLAICASEYDTLARTWFEQAASGQVLVIRDEPWVREIVPEDSELLAPVEALAERAVWAIEHWEEAIEENRRLVAHVREVRSPERSARRTLADVAWRVADTTERHAGPDAEAFRRTLAEFDRDRPDRIALDALSEAGADHTGDGAPLLDQPWCGITDLVVALRERGYQDAGDAGTPTFRRE